MSTCDKSWYEVRDRAILLTLTETGIRASELCALNLEDLDLVISSLAIRQRKGRKPRVVFCGKRTRRAILAWLRMRGVEAGALFTTQESERLTYSGLRQIVRRRAARAGIPAPGLHEFWRAFCLAQLHAGVPETAIDHMMGHATTQLIARYARQTGSDLR